ncbi:hypothetical protein KSW81_003712 [Nannochloris sp. 'desiccata']|nr:hypothetical protein KSW81_003712 [Chlorella desiccata (nom. nud.)]
MEFVSPEGLRLDGRRPKELRQLKAELGVLQSADGSATFEMGNTKVLAAVFGPKEVEQRSQMDSTKAIVRCEYAMAAFSTGERRRGSKSNRRATEISMVIRNTLEDTIILELMPRTQIDVYVQVLQADGGTRCACINAAFLALADAGIPMKDMVASCAAGYLDSTTLLDLNYTEDSGGGNTYPACVYNYTETIHVVQGEYAEISLDKNVNVLGSSDATTCLIAVLLDHPSRRAAVYHHDKSTVQLAENVIQGILPEMQSPDLYLVGAALTNNDSSNNMSVTAVLTLLQVLHSLPLFINLKLFCALEWNTYPIKRAPRCQSLAVSLMHSPHQQLESLATSITATAFPVPPGGWKDRGPLIIPRLAQIWLICDKNKRRDSVYDADKGQWTIKILEGAVRKERREGETEYSTLERPPNSIWLDFRVLDLSDADLLRVCSTSPECELPHIAGEIRTCLKWVFMQMPQVQVVEHRFRFNNARKGWEEVFNDSK